MIHEMALYRAIPSVLYVEAQRFDGVFQLCRSDAVGVVDLDVARFQCNLYPCYAFHGLQCLRDLASTPATHHSRYVQCCRRHFVFLQDVDQTDLRCELGDVQRRSSSEFVSTDTELSAMAVPATIGFSSPMAASGIPNPL